MKDEQRKEMHQVSGRLPLTGYASVLSFVLQLSFPRATLTHVLFPSGHPLSSLNTYRSITAPGLEISRPVPSHTRIRRGSTGGGQAPSSSQMPAESKERTLSSKAYSDSESSGASHRTVTELGERKPLFMRTRRLRRGGKPHEASSDDFGDADYIMADMPTRCGVVVEQDQHGTSRGALAKVPS